MNETGNHKTGQPAKMLPFELTGRYPKPFPESSTEVIGSGISQQPVPSGFALAD